MRSLIFAALCAGLPVAGAAQNFEAENGLVVVPLSATSFEVIEANGEGPRGLWCAGADYAKDRVGVAVGDRMYVKTPRGPSLSVPGRQGVVFSLDASELPAPPVQSYSISVRVQSLGLPVSHAHEFCYDYLLDMFDR